jgi:hypothetical protein
MNLRQISRGRYPCWRRTLMGAALCLMLSACALHWPWHHHPKPPPPAVHYVDVGGDWRDDIRQYWDRNTLKLDLTALSGDGEATVMPIGSVGWPVRLEFEVRPGGFARLEVLADQRVVFDVPPRGRVLTLKLDPGVYAAATVSITLRWSAADGSVR